MQSLFDNQVRANIRERMMKLTPETKAQWGKLDAPRLLTHMIDTFRVAFGEQEVQPSKSVLYSAFGRWLVIDSPIPWPKGAPSSAEFWLTRPGDFEQDRRRVMDYIDRFANGSNQKWGKSPRLGVMSAEQWSRMNYRHLNHHLTQFGL